MRKFLLMAFVVLAATKAEAGFVVNGGFENPVITPVGSYFTVFPAGDPSVTPWIITGTSVDIVNPQLYPGSTTTAYEGNQVLDLAGTPGPGAISQTIFLDPGQYTLTFAYANNPGGSPLNALVSLAGAATLSQAIVHSGSTYNNLGWATASYDFTSSGGSVTLSFSSTNGITNQGIFIDAVNIDGAGQGTEPTPEPTSMALIGFGIAGFCGAKIRRRRSVA